MVAAVGAWIVAAIAWGGYGGIAFLMALESACTPLPSEIIMPFGGYIASTGKLELWLVATAGAIGCNLGSAVAYSVGYHGGRPFLARWGHLLLLRPGDVDMAERFFARHGNKAVFFGRLLPLVRTFIALPAGIARMHFWRFHLYTFLGSWPWCFALAYVGYVLGQKWDSDPRLRGVLHTFDGVIVAAVLLGIAVFVWRHLRTTTA